MDGCDVDWIETFISVVSYKGSSIMSLLTRGRWLCHANFYLFILESHLIFGHSIILGISMHLLFCPIYYWWWGWLHEFHSQGELDIMCFCLCSRILIKSLLLTWSFCLASLSALVFSIFIIFFLSSFICIHLRVRLVDVRLASFFL